MEWGVHIETHPERIKQRVFRTGLEPRQGEILFTGRRHWGGGRHWGGSCSSPKLLHQSSCYVPVLFPNRETLVLTNNNGYLPSRNATIESAYDHTSPTNVWRLDDFVRENVAWADGEPVVCSIARTGRNVGEHNIMRGFNQHFYALHFYRVENLDSLWINNEPAPAVGKALRANIYRSWEGIY